ncbi:MAG: DUF1638 domain-containing protein [Acidobacteria bacterium]|nr:DUF1638 domain-containing protein [Acidobacteriota bacterium]
MRLKLIGCEILFRELCAAIARSGNRVDVEFLPKGLHDVGKEEMRQSLQEAVDRVDASQYEVILLGYALCGNGMAGLTARSIPLVIPRAHDCIALLMGSHERYQEYFENHPGVYFRSIGWVERGQNLEQLSLETTRKTSGVGGSLEELIARYGEENGRYLYEEFTRYTRSYRQLTFIETGLEPDKSFERQAREEAARRGWRFEKIRGDLGLFERLLAGRWNEQEFLVVPPGWRVAARYDEDIMVAEPPS